MPTGRTISNCSESVQHTEGWVLLFCCFFFEVSFKAEADCKLRVDEKTLMQLPAPKDPRAPGAQLLQLRAQCPKAHLRGSVPPGLIAPLISIPQKQNRAAVQLVSLMLKSHCRT